MKLLRPRQIPGAQGIVWQTKNYSPFLRYFFLALYVSSCYNPFGMNSMPPRRFPAEVSKNRLR
jgi:hypothetical protein